MTRSLYAGRAGDTVVSVFTLARRQVLTLPVDTNGNPAAVTLEVYDDVDGTRLTDLLAADGVTPISVVTASATDGQVPAFHGPDGVNTALWLRDPDGDYIRVEPDAATSADVAAGHASAAAADRALTQLARDTAETAAGQASTSALDAADSKDAAALSATNAATSETNAGASAAAALVSETNAADSEALAAGHRAAVEGVVATSAGVMAAVDADPDNEFRTQQDLRLSTTIAQVKAWARNPDQLVAGAVTRDSNGAAISAPVVWPDGTPGTYTADTVSTAFPGAVDAYHITYGSPVTKTYTQPAITRDATTGAATNVPQIVVS